MPDVTRAQIVALVQATIAVFVAFGAHVTEAQSVALLTLAAVIGAVLVHGDAGIRRARNQRAAIEAAIAPTVEVAEHPPLPTDDEPEGDMPPCADGCALDPKAAS